MRSILSISLGFTLCFGANAQFIEHPLTWYPESNTDIQAVDIEGDGDLDFIAVSASKGPRLIENAGSNQFNVPVYLSEEAGYSGLKVADMDGDGDLDIISLKSSAGIVSLFTNNGDDTFTESVVYNGAPIQVSLLDVNDLNGDGNPDISFRSGLTSLKWLENDGAGSFTEQLIATGSSEIYRYHHVDIDGDLDADICWFDAAITIQLYQNLGDSYAAPIELATGVNAYYGLTSIDEDADGDLDLLFSNAFADEVGILRNLGGGLFDAPATYLTYIYPRVPDPVDVDGDGQLDIILNNVAGTCHYDWLKNLGGGSFAALQTLKTTAISSISAQYVDMDDDGDLDLIDLAYGNSSIIYYENMGDGTFSDLVFLSETVREPYEICKSDLDNDGDFDLVCGSRADHKISWLENLGDGHFGRLNVVDYDPLLFANSVSTTDIDGDGDQDILAVSFYEHKTLWYENLGGGNFGPQNVLSTVHINPAYIAGADWDGDGDNDIMISSGGGGNKVVLFENDGGTFDPTGEILLYVVNPTQLIPDDLDDDGDLDVLFAANGEGTLNWLENTGDLTFSNHILATEYWSIENAIASDADEDGDLDVFFISAAMDNEIMRCENTGAGTFSSPLAVVSVASSTTVVLNVDVNNDGAKDLVVGSFGENNLVWHPNMGDFEYSDPVLISDNVISLVWAIADDFDSDGDMDLATTSFGDAKIAWFENIHTTNYSAQGKIFYDENENGILDLGEEGINFTQALTTPASYYSFTNAMGDYTIVFDETELGDYTIFPETLEYWAITTAASYDVTIDGDSALYENLDFGMYPSELVDRVDNRLTGGVASFDTEINLWLDYSNTGSTIPSGTLHLVLADQLTYISAEIAPETIDGQNIYWSYEDLGYFEDASLAVTVLVPGFDSFGDTLMSYFIIEIDSLDEPVFTNMDSLEQVVQGPVDPNDKTARPAGMGPLGYIAPETETLEYLIRFQNTGTDTAINVVIKDQLDANLDWISLRPVAWSHDMEIEVDHEGEISFIFNDIMLPDSNVNELASHGFVKYEIDLLADLPLETSIYNTAHIYFDANPAIVTNTTVNTLHETAIDDSGIEEEESEFMSIYPNPFSEFTTVRFKNNGASKHNVIIYNLLGNVVYRQDNITGNSIQINKADLGTGLYILTLVNSDKNEIIDQVKLVAE